MTIRAGQYGQLTLTPVVGDNPMPYTTYLVGWKMLTSRHMVETTPPDKDARTFMPSLRVAAVQFTGWWDNTANPWGFNDSPGTIRLYSDRLIGGTYIQYKGLLRNLVLETHVDRPNMMSGELVTSGDIVKEW